VPLSQPGSRLVSIAALVAGVLGLYAETGSYPFVCLDDPGYVVNNLRVAAGLRLSNLSWALTTLDQEFWHPLTWLSHIADVSLFGRRPGPMHLANVILHAANSTLVFLVLSRATGAFGKRALVALLFAVHPTHVESVVWISERKDVLSVFFGLLSLLAYRSYALVPGLWRYSVVLLCFAAGLMAEATLVTLPFLFLLLDVWPLGRLAPFRTDCQWTLAPTSGGPRALFEKLPLLAPAILISWITVVAQRRGGSSAATIGGHAFENAIVSYVAYARKLLWPTDLAVFYPVRESGPPPWQVLSAVLGLLAITGLALGLLRKRPGLAVGWFWYLGTLVPVIGFLRVGSHALADRYTYFPSIGFFLALVLGIGELPGKRLERLALGGTLVAVGALAFATHRQLGFLSSDEVLFRHSLAVTQRNARAHESLAYTLQEQGRLEEARQNLLASASIEPSPSNLTLLGFVSNRLGHEGGAESAYRRALKIDLSYDPASVNLSDLLRSVGREAEANQILARAATWPVRMSHFEIGHRVSLGATLVDAGQVDLGVAVLEAALSLDPGNAIALENLAGAYWYRGDRALAERTAQAALALEAKGVGAWLVLGAARMAEGSPTGAVDALSQALSANPQETFRRLPLAEALASLGRFGEACDHWRYVLSSPLATSSDRERASQGAEKAACPFLSSGR